MPNRNGHERRLGIWIDHREAKLIELNDNGDAPSVKRIESDAGEVPRSFGHVGNQPAHTGYAGDKEKHADQRRKKQLRRFYSEVADEAARNTTPARVVVLGPGQARKEFQHALEDKHALAQKIERNESVDANLTEAQVVARVKEMLGQPPARMKFG